MATKTVYNKALLDSIILRDGATLVGEYEKLNRETVIQFRCKCGNEHQKVFRVGHKSNLLCISCTKKNKQNQFTNTCLKVYGCKSPTENKDVQAKQKETCRKNLGCDYPTQNSNTMKKQADTCMAKFGYKTNLQDPATKLQIKQTCLNIYGTITPSQNDEVKQKIKKTTIKKYGVEHHLQVKEILQKQYNTNIEKYGVHIASLNSIVRKKIKQTCKDKYGFDTPLQSEEIKDKIKATCVQKYGVEYAMQNEEVFAKAQKNSKKFKNFIMPSGTVRKVQGYEPFALRDLIAAGITEDQIKTDRSDVPRIKYSAEEKDPSLHQDAGTDSEPRQSLGKDRYYFPDIFIPHENRLIEVKSTWTYKCKTDFIKQKAEAAKAAGYNYEIRIYNAKGKLVVPDSC